MVEVIENVTYNIEVTVELQWKDCANRSWTNCIITFLFPIANNNCFLKFF